jgi:hypothetical protein
MNHRYAVVETLRLKPGASAARFAEAYRELSTLDGIAREYGVSPTGENRVFRSLTDPRKVKVVYRAEGMEMLWPFYKDSAVHEAIKRVFDRFVDRDEVELMYWEEL